MRGTPSDLKSEEDVTMDDLTLWESLDKELQSMVENFGNLIKAARIPDEDADQVLP